MLRRHKIYEPSGCERSFLDAFQLRFNTSFLPCFNFGPLAARTACRYEKSMALAMSKARAHFVKTDVRVKP